MKTIEQLVIEYQTAPSDKLFKQIYVQFVPMLWKIIRKYNFGIENDDKLSMALLIVNESILLFDAEKNTKFGTFLYNKLNKEFLNQIHAQTMHKRKGDKDNISLDAEISEGITVGDSLIDSFDVEKNTMNKIMLENFVATLSPDERCLISCMVAGMSVDEVARHLGESGQKWWKILSRIREKSSKYFGEEKPW